jgi:hypothetical protein
MLMAHLHERSNPQLTAHSTQHTAQPKTKERERDKNRAAKNKPTSHITDSASCQLTTITTALVLLV